MAGIVRDFIGYSKPWQQFTPTRPEEVYGQRPAEYYQYTLSSALTHEHLEKQPKHLQKIREMREGNSIDIHKNNLDKRVDNARRLKENKKLGLVAPKPKAQKRKAEVENNEESVLDENIIASSPRSKRQRKESAGSPSSPKSRRKQNIISSRVTKKRRTRSTASNPGPKKVNHEDADFVPPSPKKRKQSDSDSVPESEPKRRRSSRSPKTPTSISWTDNFHPGLSF
jgi:lipopolysaccharide biosynthesis glycosyltransferase